MKRHPTDTVSLVFGLLFAAVVGFWALHAVTDSTPRLPAAWIGAIALLIIGVVGLVGSLRPQRNRAVEGGDYDDAFAMDHSAAMAGYPLDPTGTAYPLLDASRMDPLLLDPETVAEEYRRAGFDDAPTSVAVASAPVQAAPSSGPPAAPPSAPPVAEPPAAEAPAADDSAGVDAGNKASDTVVEKADDETGDQAHRNAP
jgi:hypothetical protein